MRKKGYPRLLLWLFLAIWAILAVNPSYRYDWFLENILIFIGLPFLWWLHHRTPLSNLSYTLIFAFLVFHSYGAHYTYSETPLGKIVSEALGFERNHYDRWVHFLWGFLLTLPLYEVFSKKISRKKPIVVFWLAVSTSVTLGVAYEFMEWAAAVVVAPEAGTAFLGTQGDEWDAQKDLLMHSVGALTSYLFLYFLNRSKA
jgi:putative membrane protein